MNNWVIRERNAGGQWVTVIACERFSEAVKHLSPERQILRNGKVLRPQLINHQRALLGTALEVPDED